MGESHPSRRGARAADSSPPRVDVSEMPRVLQRISALALRYPGRLALAVLQLERRFVRADGVISRVQAGLRQLSGEAQAQGSAHPDVIAALARLYADTVSTLRPRIMVQGNPHYLGQAGVVAEIRALLLAALRSAVLWRQLGGSLWDFVLRRREMAAAIDARLA